MAANFLPFSLLSQYESEILCIAAMCLLCHICTYKANIINEISVDYIAHSGSCNNSVTRDAK